MRTVFVDLDHAFGERPSSWKIKEDVAIGKMVYLDEAEKEIKKARAEGRAEIEAVVVGGSFATAESLRKQLSSARADERERIIRIAYDWWKEGPGVGLDAFLARIRARGELRPLKHAVFSPGTWAGDYVETLNELVDAVNELREVKP